MREEERKEGGRSRGGEYHPTGQYLEQGVAYLVSGGTWLLGLALSQHALSVWQPQAREGTLVPTCATEARKGPVSSESVVRRGRPFCKPHHGHLW